MGSPLINGKKQLHCVHWIVSPIIVYLGSGTCRAAYRKRRTTCVCKQDTVTCFTSWTVHYHLFAERVLFRRPSIFEAASVLQDHIRNGIFPNRRLRQRPPAPALEAHQVALNQLRQNAEAHQRTHPVNFELTNEWTETITADKRHHRDYQLKGLTG